MTRTGRPSKPADQRAESFLHIRCRQRDKAMWVKQAQKEGTTIAKWVIATLNKEAEKA